MNDAPAATPKPQPRQLMEIIQGTPTNRIAELDIVKEKFIQNYNQTHKDQMGDLMYHRQLVNLKQLLANSADLRAVDPFSLYAVIVTAAAKGYSMDPADNEIYIVPIKGKAAIWRQAGAHVRRLIETSQIKYVDQPKIVYQGDEFEVERGRVVKHVEKFASETYVAAYIRFELDETGADRYFIYRKSDWEAWKKKAPAGNKATWEGGPHGQPDPGFLRTKIIKHACIEKVWASGSTPPLVEVYHDVEYEELPAETETQKPGISMDFNQQSPAPITKTVTVNDDEVFEVAETIKEEAGVTVGAGDDEF